MIRIERGLPPRALCRERARQLSRVRGVRADRSLKSSDFTGHEVARGALWEAQHHKCAYCEMQVEQEASPVEHFRPKTSALRDSGRRDTGYWWLAWHWDNLLFACHRCNTTYKGDLFPLEDEDDVLEAEDPPPGAERALLVDPGAQGGDPLDHIVFTDAPDGRWKPIGRTSEGRRTIEVLRLDTLLDRYHRRVEAALAPGMSEIRAALERGEQAVATRLWRELVKIRLDPYQPFLALTWCVLDTRFPEAERTSLGWELPRPWVAAPAPSAIQVEEARLLGELSPQVRDQACALGRRREHAAWDAVLVAVLGERPSTLEELVVILARSERSVRAHLQRLEHGGRVQVAGGTWGLRDTLPNPSP